MLDEIRPSASRQRSTARAGGCWWSTRSSTAVPRPRIRSCRLRSAPSAVVDRLTFRAGRPRAPGSGRAQGASRRPTAPARRYWRRAVARWRRPRDGFTALSSKTWTAVTPGSMVIQANGTSGRPVRCVSTEGPKALWRRRAAQGLACHRDGGSIDIGSRRSGTGDARRRVARLCRPFRGSAAATGAAPPRPRSCARAPRVAISCTPRTSTLEEDVARAAASHATVCRTAGGDRGYLPGRTLDA